MFRPINPPLVLIYATNIAALAQNDQGFSSTA
ncbi:hypothetical protein ACVIU4_000935 [Bradyrhizobium barranii subsp. barranii]|nr:hypothetical protein [Bradyrhizobium japonicum]MCP1963833.1 hypothetical protein [Bradyrhizobium japonicum]